MSVDAQPFELDTDLGYPDSAVHLRYLAFFADIIADEKNDSMDAEFRDPLVERDSNDLRPPKRCVPMMQTTKLHYTVECSPGFS